MSDRILVSISGWGSDQRIFEELLARSPQLQSRRHIPLPWQDFVAAQPPGKLGKLGKLSSLGAELLQKDTVLLGWSLGSMLCLELALHFSAHFPAHLPAKLVLLSPSAAMCGSSAAPSSPSNLPSPSKVNPAVLKLMQRKLKEQGEQGDQVLLDFARNASSPVLAKGFVSSYLEQAKGLLQSSPQSLCAGLDYLIRCDLRKALDTLAFPCLVASGRHDKIMPTAQAVELAQLLPRAELLQMDLGHNLLLPPPKELLEAIERFLDASL